MSTPSIKAPALDAVLDWSFAANIWFGSLQALSEAPWTGVGLARSTAVGLRLPLAGVRTIVPHAHNLALQVGLDLGLPGLVAYAALILGIITVLVVVLRRGRSHVYDTEHSWQRRALRWSLALGCVGSLVAYLIHGLTDAALWGNKPAFLIWGIYAVVVLLFLQGRRRV